MTRQHLLAWHLQETLIAAWLLHRTTRDMQLKQMATTCVLEVASATAKTSVTKPIFDRMLMQMWFRSNETGKHRSAKSWVSDDHLRCAPCRTKKSWIRSEFGVLACPTTVSSCPSRIQLPTSKQWKLSTPLGLACRLVFRLNRNKIRGPVPELRAVALLTRKKINDTLCHWNTDRLC